MPGGRTKFQQNWLDIIDGNGDVISNWCAKTKNEGEAYCIVCKCTISISNSGKSQLLQHASKQKHSKASKQFKNQTFLKNFCGVTSGDAVSSSNSNSSSVVYSDDQLVKRAEALWAMKVATSNYTFGSCKDIKQLFKMMFGDNNAVINGMQLSERKISYILSHGLGPFFHETTILDVKTFLTVGGYFSLAFDETTTCQVKKQLDVYIRYWSASSDRIISAYLTSVFLGHADAKTVYDKLVKNFDEADLPLEKLIMLSMDGPNVNHSIETMINEELVRRQLPKLINLDTCPLHKVHNSFKDMLNELPFNVDEFAIDLFSFFKYSAARREDLKNLQVLLECEERFLIRHVNSRWLTIGPVVERILSIYPSLEEYFLKFLPKQKESWSYVQKSARYQRIVGALRDARTVVFLHFTLNISKNLKQFLKIFQEEGPLVHLLYSELIELLRGILLKFVKEECVGRIEANKLLNVDLHNFDHYKSLKDLDIGVGTKQALSKLKEVERKNVRFAIRLGLIKLAESLKKNLPYKNGILQNLSALHPALRNTETEKSFTSLCIAIQQLKMSTSDIDSLVLEWKAYRLDAKVDKVYENFKKLKEKRIDLFWKQVFNIKDLSDKKKYGKLEIFVKTCLSLSHGNADVERGFSLNKDLMLDKRFNLSESAIIGIRQVKDSVRRYGDIFSVPISGKLLEFVRKSHAVYSAVKEEEKRAAVEKKRKRTLEESEAKKIDELKRKKMDNEEKIKEVSNKINELQEELTSANQCLIEGNNRLQDAVKLKDFSTVRVTSAIIDGASSKIKTLTKNLSNAQEELKKLSL